jgi:hypothetical protein
MMLAAAVFLVMAALMMIQHKRCTTRCMYLADYILFMFADPSSYETFRSGFKDGMLTLDKAFLNKHMWLYANDYMCKFTEQWGKECGSPVATESVLRKWLQD